MAVYSLNTKMVEAHSVINSSATNMVKVDAYFRPEKMGGYEFRFLTCGNNGSIVIWNFETSSNTLNCEECLIEQ